MAEKLNPKEIVSVEEVLRSIFIIFLTVVVASCSQGVRPDVAASASKAAKSYLESMKSGDFKMSVDLMDPRMFSHESLTSEEEQKIRDYVLAKAQSISGKYLSITVYEPTKYFRNDTSEHVLIPYKAYGIFEGTNGTYHSMLIATRYPTDKPWYFIDAGTKKKEIIKKYYPELPWKIPYARFTKESESEDWKIVTKYEDASLYYDSESISYPSENIITVWTKSIFLKPKKTIEMGTEYVKALMRFNCEQRMSKADSIFAYDGIGMKEKYPPQKTSDVFTSIRPGSNFETLYNILCSKKTGD